MRNTIPRQRVTAILILALLIGACGSFAKASGVPPPVAGDSPGPDVELTFQSASSSSDEQGDDMAFVPADPLMGITANDGSAATASLKQKWTAGLGYVATAAGLVAAFAPAIASHGGQAVAVISNTPASGDGGVKANDELPVPEPSALILAGLAISSAFVHLRKRR